MSEEDEEQKDKLSWQEIVSGLIVVGFGLFALSYIDAADDSWQAAGRILRTPMGFVLAVIFGLSFVIQIGRIIFYPQHGKPTRQPEVHLEPGERLMTKEDKLKYLKPILERKAKYDPAAKRELEELLK